MAVTARAYSSHSQIPMPRARLGRRRQGYHLEDVGEQLDGVARATAHQRAEGAQDDVPKLDHPLEVVVKLLVLVEVGVAPRAPQR